jgi:hypothetical protein
LLSQAYLTCKRLRLRVLQYPLTPSSAPNLPAFFHAGSAPGIRPSELSSSYAGGCRPPAAVTLLSLAPHTFRQCFLVSNSLQANHQKPTPTSNMSSPPSGLCSAQESATSHRRFRPIQVHSSLELLPSRASSLLVWLSLHLASPLELASHPSMLAAGRSPGYQLQQSRLSHKYL